MRNLAMDEWAAQLGNLTAEQIRNGLDMWDSKWPPNVYEFRNACTGKHGEDLHNTAAYKPFRPGLPKPKAKPETASAALQAMRQRQAMALEDMETELRRLRR